MEGAGGGAILVEAAKLNISKTFISEHISAEIQEEFGSYRHAEKHAA